MVLSMERWEGKVAIITGASSGIGASIVEQLVDKGLKVVGLARRENKLEELKAKLSGKSGQFYPKKADVTKEEEILEVFAWVKNNLGPVHILINNAGMGKREPFTENSTETFKNIVETNFLSFCIATREALKQMQEDHVDGHILLMNSVLGHYTPPLPNVTMYSATKHAITALTESLRQELNLVGSKIKITSISPGAVATEIWVKSGFFPSMEEAEKMFPFLQPEDITDAVVYALSTPPHVQVHELIIRPVGEPF